VYTFYFASACKKDLKKLSHQVRKEIPTFINFLASNPYHGEKLHGLLTGIWKYEFSSKGTSYRIAYRILEKEKVVLIIMIGSRESFYERLKRRVK
jgi:addiction module RelE/StbE family toxin